MSAFEEADAMVNSNPAERDGADDVVDNSSQGEELSSSIMVQYGGSDNILGMKLGIFLCIDVAI